ncbi:MAG: NAD(P)/FAD-dependent oxidoreductase, partial [Gemmatimonadaceae bacterium]|nr:NAD(P)/FAD-dependent oxidoreductase [Gemmatimonadaceae bacterium]
MTQATDGRSEQYFDVAIVGGGPAGLSAAIWLGRYLHSVVLVDSGDPRNWETRGINGFLGLPGIRPPEIRERGREECRSLGVTLIDDVAVRATQHGEEAFTLGLEEHVDVHARRLLVAIGLRDLWPDVPGLEHIYGANAHVCPDCDGYACRDRKTVVLGAGRRAVGLALTLTTWTRDIVICTDGEPPELDRPEYCEKLDALNIPVLTEPIKRVTHDGERIYSIEFDNGMCLDADKVFFAIGQEPADAFGDGLCTQLGCERDEAGSVVVDAHGHTSVRNVFAAGDITPGPQLAV